MHLAKKYVHIDQNDIVYTENFISNQRVSRDGYHAYYIETDPDHTLVKTGNKDVYLTAYIYIILNHDMNHYDEQVENFLRDSYASLTDNYDRVISCYALHLYKKNFGTTNYETCFKHIMDISELKMNRRSLQSNHEIHSSAYALMITNERDLEETSMEFFRYLIDHQDASGVFGDIYFDSMSSVLATEALTKFASKMLEKSDVKNNFEIIFSREDGVNKTIKINEAFGNVFEIFYGDPKIRKYRITAKGSGKGLAKVEWIWNSKSDKSSKFKIEINHKLISENFYHVNYCFDVVEPFNTANILAEINLPSGFFYHHDADFESNLPDVIDKVKPLNDNTKLDIYFRKVIF